MAQPNGTVIRPAKPWASTATTVCSATAPREQWLAARRSMVCASDVAAILGVSPYDNDAFTVWADKTGNAPDKPTTDAMRRGQVFEDAIVQLWAERFAGFPIETRRAGLMRAKHDPYAGATVDRLSVCNMDDEPSRCVVEVKSQADMSDWTGDDGDDVPVSFQLQGLWQLYVTGRDHVHYVALGPRFIPEHRVIRRPEALIAELGVQMHEWYEQHVVGDVRPEPTAKAADTVRRMFFRPEPGAVCVVDDELAPLVHDTLRARDARDEAQVRLDAALAALQLVMGNRTELQWPDGEPVATWRPGRKLTGVTKDWCKANPELVAQYTVPVPDATELQTAKLVENHPELIERGELRYSRTFNWKA